MHFSFHPTRKTFVNTSGPALGPMIALLSSKAARLLSVSSWDLHEFEIEVKPEMARLELIYTSSEHPTLLV